jgi:hypothetical protein
MLRMNRSLRVLICATTLLAVTAWVWPQSGLPQNVPQPNPTPPPPEEAEDYEPVGPESDEPWGLDLSFIEPLYDKAAVYEDYIRRFTCDEQARLAEYDAGGQVSSERTRRYGYLLIDSEIDHSVREHRQELGKDGSLKGGEVRDEEPFPPAYAWVFLFSRFNEPYFSFRLVDDRFDGFDWIYEIQFRGSLPFRTGKDIREWEGTVLIDAVTHSPLEIIAEPAGQQDRIETLYRQWRSSFNVMGMRTAPKPLGYRAQIQFRHRDRDAGLTFPTDMRYDTFTAVSTKQTIPVRASIRSYSKYRIFKVTDEEEIGEPNN